MLRNANVHCSLVIVILLTVGFGLSSAKADRSAQAVGKDGSSSSKALPDATAGTPLSVFLLPTFNEKRERWGEWESVSTIYYLKNTAGRKVKVAYEDKAGLTVYLKDASGHVRKVNTAGGVAEGFGGIAPLTAIEVPQDANVTSMELSITHLFGELKAGSYAVVVEIPANGLTLDGKRLGKMVSKPWRFDVVALTPELKKKIVEPTQAPKGVTLKVVKTKNKQGIEMRGLKLTNDSKQTIVYSGYEGDAGGITMTENFCGDGKWRQQFMGLCGTGLISKHLQPGESAIVGMSPLAVAPKKGTVSITRPVIGISVLGQKNAYYSIGAEPTVHLGE